MEVRRVKPEEVPVAGASGQWTRLADQVVEAHRAGEVLVVTMANRQEAKRMINGMSERLRQSGYARAFVTQDEPDGRATVFCQLLDKEVHQSVVVSPIRKPRKRASG